MRGPWLKHGKQQAFLWVGNTTFDTLSMSFVMTSTVQYSTKVQMFSPFSTSPYPGCFLNRKTTFIPKTNLVALISSIFLSLKQVWHPTVHRTAPWLNMKLKRPKQFMKVLMVVTLLFDRHESTNDPQSSCNYKNRSLKYTVLALQATITFFKLVSAKASQKIEIRNFTVY